MLRGTEHSSDSSRKWIWPFKKFNSFFYLFFECIHYRQFSRSLIFPPNPPLFSCKLSRASCSDTWVWVKSQFWFSKTGTISGISYSGEKNSQNKFSWEPWAVSEQEYRLWKNNGKRPLACPPARLDSENSGTDRGRSVRSTILRIWGKMITTKWRRTTRDLRGG